MGLPVEKLGTTSGPVTAVIDAGRARKYAEATNDGNPAYAVGTFAPPIFAVVPTWEAITRTVGAVVPPEALPMVVHGEQDMHFRQPLVPGRSLVTEAEAHSIRVSRSGTRFTTRVRSHDEETGDEVLEQYVTMFIRGMADGHEAGPDKPDHALDPAVRGDLVGSRTVHVDDDQTFRYREASGDPMPIHTDDAFARAVGLPGIIAHGLCTMAMSGASVLALVAGDDPARLRRLAVRFARNVFPGDDITTTLYRLRDGGGAGDRVFGFEATSSRGDTVITNGRVELAG